MVTRRDVMMGSLLASGAAPAFAGHAGGLQPACDGPLRFGVVADPQYAPVVPNLATGRCYSNSLGKLQEAVQAFNTLDLSFVVTQGDIIDRHWESYSHIMPVYDGLRHEARFLLGNHDFAVAEDYRDSIVSAARMDEAYYEFTRMRTICGMPMRCASLCCRIAASRPG